MNNTQDRSNAPVFAPLALPGWVLGDADPFEITVLLALQSCGASGEDGCDVSLKELTLIIGKVARNTVIKNLDKLEKRGWLTRTRQIFDDGTMAPTNYKLHVWECRFTNE